MEKCIFDQGFLTGTNGSSLRYRLYQVSVSEILMVIFTATEKETHSDSVDPLVSDKLGNSFPKLLF